ARIGVLPGEERHFLGDFDLRLLVVHGHDLRRRDDVVVRIRPQGAQDRGEVRARIHDAPNADAQTGRCRCDRRWVVDCTRQIHDAGAGDGLNETAHRVTVGTAVDGPIDAEVDRLVYRDLYQDRLEE